MPVSKPSGAPIACCYAVLEFQLSKWVSSLAAKIVICIGCPLPESRSTGYILDCSHAKTPPLCKPYLERLGEWTLSRILTFFRHPLELRSWNPNSGLDLQLLDSDHFKHMQKSLLCVSAFCSWISLPCLKQYTPKLCGQWFCLLRSKSCGLMSAYRFYFVLL